LYLVKKVGSKMFRERLVTGAHEMDGTALKLMLEGIEPGRLRKRYRLPKSFQKSPSNTSSSSITALQCVDGTSADEQATERG
jgi:hypothetical protein